MPDVIEAAKSGRAKCRRCGEAIAKATPRFGEEVDNTFGEGKAHHWFHLRCAAEKRPEKLLAALGSAETNIDDRDELATIAQSGIDNPDLVTVARAERAKTGRARCQHCREKIDKGTLRVAIEREDELATASVSYVHARCAPARVGLSGLRDKLRRVSTELGDEDFAELDSLLGAAAG